MDTPLPPLNIRDTFPPPTWEQWRELVDRDLKGAPYQKKLVTPTYDGIPIEPLYSERDWPSRRDEAGLPGAWPYVRGARPEGKVPMGWDIRQLHRHPSPDETNRRILTDLERGVNSILLRFDNASRAGLDPQDPAAEQWSAPDGVIIASADDMATVLKGVYLDIAPVSLDAGGQFLTAAGFLVEAFRRAEVKLDRAMGHFSADPLRALVRDGELPVSLDEALAQMVDLAHWTAAHCPNITAVQVSTSQYHHHGANSIQDLAFSMATGLTYLKAMVQGGLAIEAACRQMVFSYAVGTNLFLAIAKLRAARKLWARVVQAMGGPTEALAMKMHVRTSQRVITARDPWVNMLRTTVGCFAAAVGGADSITTPPFDSQIGLPDDFSMRMARNTQLILLEESHLSRVVDPAGGSWYVEKLTDELARRGWELFQQIERRGGMPEAILSGWADQQIDEAFAPRLKNLGKRKDAITGVSEYPNLREEAIERKVPDLAELRGKAQARATDVDDATVAAALEALGRAVAARDRRTGQLTQAVIEAAAAGASLGMIARELAKGSERLVAAALSERPFGEPFEALRNASDEYAERHGERPRVFLANMGAIAQHTARAGYSHNFFEAGGFEVVSNTGFKTTEAAAEAFRESGARIAVICSSDALYEEFVPQVAPALKQAGAEAVIVAGRPGEHKDAWRAAGVDRFIFIGCDVLETLRSLWNLFGVETDDRDHW